MGVGEARIVNKRVNDLQMEERKMKLIGKRIVGTKMEDARFLRGQNVIDGMNNDFEFGKQFTLDFDDGTSLVVSIARDSAGDKLIGAMTTNGD